MAPQDALVVREQQAGPEHAVVQYSAEDLSRPKAGPANPFKSETTAVKRKNVLTGHAEETFLSEHTFRSKHRAIERQGGPERAYQTGADRKEEEARARKARESKGDALVAEGAGAYVGPWAKHNKSRYEIMGEDEELGSDDEYEVVEEDDEDDVVASGTVVQAPTASLARRQEEKSVVRKQRHSTDLRSTTTKAELICMSRRTWTLIFAKRLAVLRTIFPRSNYIPGRTMRELLRRCVSSPSQDTCCSPAVPIPASRSATCTTTASFCEHILDIPRLFRTFASTTLARSSFRRLMTA